MKTKREKRGDWPEELDVIEDEAVLNTEHDAPPPPGEDDAKQLRKQEANERTAGHPAEQFRLDDPSLD